MSEPQEMPAELEVANVIVHRLDLIGGSLNAIFDFLQWWVDPDSLHQPLAWRPVDICPPPDGRLLLWDGKEMHAGEYSLAAGGFIWGGDHRPCAPTHWAALPSPPGPSHVVSS